MPDKFYEQARIMIQKLSPEPGDILTINFPDDMSTEQVHSTIKYLQYLGEQFECTVIALSRGISLDTISEKQMNSFGWYRGPASTIDKGKLS